MKVLIVTPFHNERHNLGPLASQVRASSVTPAKWVLVDDGSTDGSLAVARGIEQAWSEVVSVVSRHNAGGLIGGSAFSAWQFGIDHVPNVEDFDFVMKLDADVELPCDYLELCLREVRGGSSIGLVGGRINRTRDREQSHHVPGPVKLYTAAGYASLNSLPRVVGFDVMDEIQIGASGLTVQVLRTNRFDMRRPIGGSQGLLHGRRRNGLVCRWTGYSPTYFALHALRYAFRKPVFLGAICMVYGYLTSPASPYDPALLAAHGSVQRSKLKAAVRSPLTWLKETYG